MRSLLNQAIVVCLTISSFTGTYAQDKPGPLKAVGRAIDNAVESRRARRELLEQRLLNARENSDAYRREIQNNLQNQFTSEANDSVEDNNKLTRARYRADWHDWSQNRYEAHREWYRGPWQGPTGTPAANSWWQYRWSQYPVYTTLGVAPWTAYRGAYRFGLSGYRNPFFVPPPAGTTVVIDYGQPIYAASANTSVAASLNTFNQAREAFFNRDYPSALRLVDLAVAASPNDAIIHEFRSLVLFAQKQYGPSATAAYAVLAAGPPWSYRTMIGLYPDEGTYLGHLKQLERYRADHSDAPDTRFLLGYHYLVKGDSGAASREFEAFLRLVPNDPVGIELLSMVGGQVPDKPSVLSEQHSDFKVDRSKLIGTWRGPKERDYELVLKDNGEFTWVQQGSQAPLEGVYALEGSNVVLESDDGSVIVGRISPVDNGFAISLGDGQGVQMLLVP
ncbi:tetratricopeptide repeat protein [bacterium]|nr:tetratricopeptide repeat protein [bacterium]